MQLVFDIEANGLLPTVSKFHCAGAIDIKTGKTYWFKPHQLREFLDLLDNAERIIAHNAFGYDVPALKILANKTLNYDWDVDPNKVQCTKVMSQLLNFRRFGFGHSLKQWGIFFNDHKGDYTGGWEEYNNEMFVYMQQDVKLGAKVYMYLIKELKHYIANLQDKVGGNIDIKSKVLQSLRSEMEMDRIMVKQTQNGWPFNKEAAQELVNTVNAQMKEIENYINPKLGMQVKSPDGSVKKISDQIKELKKEGVHESEWPEIPSKKATFTKLGKYYSHVESWFGELNSRQFDPSDIASLPVWGEYTRIQFECGDVGNTDTVKEYLYSIGWKPDEWNWKRIDGEFVRVSPKLSDSSLAPLGDVGTALMEYYTLRSRKSILEGWFDYIDSDSRLHGDVFNIGTPTFRQTHKIIANLPSGKATLGKEIRELFVSRDGYKLVSADSAACQLRLLAHFMRDPSFTKEVLEGDIHQKNADILGCDRSTAKPFIFAFLYGAGGKKLGSILKVSEAEGNQAKQKYLKSIPALQRLINNCKHEAEEVGYITGLDARPIYVESAHKALNYLIQGAEAVVMKYTIIMIEEELEKAGLDASILLFYHDEVTYEVKEEQAETAREIIMRCFEEAPKKLGVDIMTCGDCKIGDDYYDVH